MPSVQTADFLCQYSLLCSLRQAGYTRERIYRAMAALFDPEPVDELDLYEEIDEPFEPTDEDLADHSTYLDRFEVLGDPRYLSEAMLVPALDDWNEATPSGGLD